MQSGNQESESAAGDVPSSCTEQGVAAGDCAEDVHSQHADDVSTCSQITEQDATSCLCMSEQDATPSSSRTQNQNHNTDALLGSPPISSATPFPRQFWKAGEYNVAAQASISSMFLTFSFKLGNLFTIPPINVTCPVQSVHHGRLGGSPYLSIPLLAIVFWNLLTRSPLFQCTLLNKLTLFFLLYFSYMPELHPTCTAKTLRCGYCYISPTYAASHPP
jgi:hypothetical protein